MIRFAVAPLLAVAVALWAQQPTLPVPAAPEAPDTTLAAVQKLGPSAYRLGDVRVDTALREVSVSGTVNDVQVLEFVANTKGGYKAYESALTLEPESASTCVVSPTSRDLGLTKSSARRRQWLITA